MLFRCFLVLHFLFLIAFSCLTNAKSEDSPVVKIGCLFPMSGPGARYGMDSIAAIEIAEQEIKSEGLVKNYRLQTIFRDTKSKPIRAIQQSRHLIENEDVTFLCGVVSSSVALAVTDVAKRKQVIFIGTDHASPHLITKAHHDYYFRMNNGTRQSMRAGAKYIKQQHERNKALKIAFIGPDYDYGYHAWDDLRYFLKQENVNFKVHAEFWPKLNEADFTPYIDLILKSPPDILIDGHWGTDLVNFIRQAKKRKLFEKVKFMNFDAGGNYETLAKLGNDMPQGVILSARHHVNWPPTKDNKNFVTKFFEKTKRYPSYAAQGAYAGIKAIAKILAKQKGQLDNKILIEKLKSLKIKLPEDPTGFESFIDSESHQIMQVQAIGKTIKSSKFHPAKTILGEWNIYYPPQSWPRMKSKK